jgi:hypothetical protein
MEELRLQRYDDHRLYHHSRVNQSLHLVSACSFLTSYAMLAHSPTMAALIGWIVAMWSRQIGHFFFEPHDYDDVNGMSHHEKEEVKVGYNLQRKAVLLAVWLLSPLVLYVDPDLFGLIERHDTSSAFVDNLAVMWLALGIIGLGFRTVQLFFLRGVQTGLVLCTKILTDPVHDIKLYRNAPIRLLRGEKYDPELHTVEPVPLWRP